MKWHYLDSSLAKSNHKITINLIGCGGTGSHVLSNLAMMNAAMKALGKQPLFVRVWDDDTVSETNIGRQLFSPSDINRNKAEVLVTRINRFYGFNWESVPQRFEPSERFKNPHESNITISCVDSVQSRKDVFYCLRNKHASNYVLEKSYYWLDIGNSLNSGQIILGTIKKTEQPRNGRKTLPTFIDEYPNVSESKDQPSCSMAESLARQDLFINKTLATMGVNILWDLFKNYRINYRGIYFNQTEMKSIKILI